MFGNISGMVGTYEARKVGRYDDGPHKMVSTARVTDGKQEFETAFMHPEYNDGEMVIVEAYDTKADALAGHERWVTTMKNGPLPDELVSCLNSGISDFCGETKYSRKIEKE